MGNAILNESAFECECCRLVMVPDEQGVGESQETGRTIVRPSASAYLVHNAGLG